MFRPSSLTPRRPASLRILFDKNVAVPLRRFLIGHEVDGAARRGWDRLKNGELLQRAEDEGFDILITGDKDDYMVYERTMQRRKIALIVLGAGNWPNV